MIGLCVSWVFWNHCKENEQTHRKKHTYTDNTVFQIWIVFKNKTIQKIWEFDKNNTSPSDEELIKWAKKQISKEVKPCIDEIIKLDKDNKLYKNKIKQSILYNATLNNSDFDATTIGKGMFHILKVLHSPIFDQTPS